MHGRHRLLHRLHGLQRRLHDGLHHGPALPLHGLSGLLNGHGGHERHQQRYRDVGLRGVAGAAGVQVHGGGTSGTLVRQHRGAWRRRGVCGRTGGRSLLFFHHLAVRVVEVLETTVVLFLQRLKDSTGVVGCIQRSSIP